MRVSTDFAKLLQRYEHVVKERVMAALRRRAEEAKVIKRDIVEENSRIAWSSPSVSSDSLSNWHAVRDLRMQHAAEKKKALDAAKEKYIADLLQWKKTFRSRRQLNEERQKQKEEMCDLLSWVLVSARTSIWIETLTKHREKMREIHRKAWAVGVIVRRIQEFIVKKYNKRYRSAMLVIAVRFGWCVKRWRDRFKGKKAKILSTFLNEVSAHNQLRLAVAQFRRRILKCQEIAREYIKCNRARYKLLELQFDRVDHMRIQSFYAKREVHMQRVKREIIPRLRLRGKKQEELEHKMKMIARIGGPKTVRTCESELEKSRNKYLELFLSADVREAPAVSPVVKRKMLELYTKRIRLRYTQAFVAYRKKLDAWKLMQDTQKNLNMVASTMMSDMEGTKAESYLATKFQSVLNLAPPIPPLMNSVLPREIMEEIVQKAVEHTLRLQAKQAAKAKGEGGHGILKHAHPEDEGPTMRKRYRQKRKDSLVAAGLGRTTSDHTASHLVLSAQSSAEDLAEDLGGALPPHRTSSRAVFL